MFGSIGGAEIVLIFVVALIVFGPRRLPEIGRRMGAAVRELRRASGEFRAQVEQEVGIDPLTGLETARRARRDVFSTVGGPVRDAARGAIEVLAEAGEETPVTPGRDRAAPCDEPLAATELRGAAPPLAPQTGPDPDRGGPKE